jgi:hypothetical protein
VDLKRQTDHFFPAHYPHRKTQEEGLVDISAACVRRLLELGLPEYQAFQARDAIVAAIENFNQRRTAGEWEPR